MQNRFKFTKTAIQQLAKPPAGKRADYSDTEVPHLAVRVAHTGSKSFSVSRKINGRFVRVTLGRFPALSVEQARKLAKTTNFQLSVGENPNMKKKADQRLIELGVTKNGEKQTAFMATLVERVMKERRGNGSDYVFPTPRSTSKTPYLQSPKKAWATILKRAKISDFHIHDLRSVLPSWAAQKGIGDFLIQKMTQHKDLRSLRVYQRLRDTDPVRELQETTGNQVLQAAGLLPAMQS